MEEKEGHIEVDSNIEREKRSKRANDSYEEEEEEEDDDVLDPQGQHDQPSTPQDNSIFDLRVSKEEEEEVEEEEIMAEAEIMADVEGGGASRLPHGCSPMGDILKQVFHGCSPVRVVEVEGEGEGTMKSPT